MWVFNFTKEITFLLKTFVPCSRLDVRYVCTLHFGKGKSVECPHVHQTKILYYANTEQHGILQRYPDQFFFFLMFVVR